ncbi:PREDICTED: uncharacterized protein LOC108563722 [Nicrophorus vespilloides]|uniref:Uncharacterized protein LOC108563722 n=1 Tax=Nicrophorus vespilloides TaxID=110193 RepID=A0ABM1MTR7_NICVS|nr:PREDICTED: uncharacterized protein LOC108563722 [Nicrophorus vespilloides]
MSSLPWIKTSKRLLEAVGLVNSIPDDDDMYREVLLQSVEGDFPEEYLKSLESSLKLSGDNVQILVQCIEYIMTKANQIIIKPSVLQKNLVEVLKFENEKAECFVKVWSEQAAKRFGDLGTRKKVDDVTWEIVLRSDELRGRFQLSLSDFLGADDERVTLDLSEAELTELYLKLEDCQNKLDSLR